MDMIWFSLKSIWCAMTGCYQCVDYTVPELTLPDSFYVEKIYNEPPKGVSKWKGEPPETYRYAAVIDGLVYKIVGPVERLNNSSAVYSLIATSQRGESVTLRVTKSQFMKKGHDDLSEESPKNEFVGYRANHSYEGANIIISSSNPRVDARLEVVPLIAGHPSKDPLVIQVNSYKSYPNAYCYSEFRY